MPTSYLFLAEGFEEIEAIATVDVLRRAQIDVKVVSISDSKCVKGAHGVCVCADAILQSAAVAVSDNEKYKLEEADWLILPGGMPGATNLVECKPLTDLLKKHFANGGRIAAICASPAVVLSPLGIVNSLKATCYPGFEPQLEKGGAIATGQRVVLDENVLTANGPATAIDFGLAIAEQTVGKEVAAQVAKGMLRV